MEDSTQKAIEKMFGRKVCHLNLNIAGFAKSAAFDVYDGFAICEDYEGKELMAEYPKMEAIRDSVEIADAIIAHVGTIVSSEDITPLQSLLTFSKLYVDGVEVQS